MLPGPGHVTLLFAQLVGDPTNELNTTFEYDALGRILRLEDAGGNRTVEPETVAVGDDATLAVFDLAGRRVVTLVDREVEAGRHEVVWNGTNEAGDPVASGVYFSRLMAMGEEHSAKMVLLK